MCHTVVAQRMCQVCRRSQGETVIDFERCARKCYSPFYCLTPIPQMEICSLCATGSPGDTTSTTSNSTPVLSRNSSIDANGNEAVSTAAAAAVAGAGAPTTAAIPGVSTRVPTRRLS